MRRIRGLSSWFTITVDLTTQTNLNLYTFLQTRGWSNTSKKLRAFINIPSGVSIYSTNPALPALTIPNSFRSYDMIQITNNGSIVGAGGVGGVGGLNRNGSSGGTGGSAMSILNDTAKNLKIINNGNIHAGGGGGGGGGGYSISNTICNYGGCAVTYDNCSAWNYPGCPCSTGGGICPTGQCTTTGCGCRNWSYNQTDGTFKRCTTAVTTSCDCTTYVTNYDGGGGGSGQGYNTSKTTGVSRGGSGGNMGENGSAGTSSSSYAGGAGGLAGYYIQGETSALYNFSNYGSILGRIL